MSRYEQSAYAELVPVGNDLAFISSYDAKLVDRLKALIPFNARRWDPANKRWIVSLAYASVCVDIAYKYLGVKITPPGTTAAPAAETKLLKIEYIGRCKPRENGISTAFGWVSGAWSVIFPEAVLRDYFAADPTRPDEQATLYAVLAIKPDAKADDIKTSYRRLAKQWHPDVCHEIGAAETFKAIQRAYETLSDDLMRQKYDIGLRLVSQLLGAERMTSEMARSLDSQYGYRSPFRCGYVLVSGKASLGRFVVAKILEWRDIVDEAGRVMTVSWPVGATEHEVAWV